jgi:alcohol dehydrogenase (cytochrome c)
MRRLGCRWRLAAVGVTIALAVASTVGCGSTDPRPAGPSRDWAVPNADLANTRNVPSLVDRSTVGDLKVAWTMPVNSFASTPVVVDGVVYAQDLASNVYAIDLASGGLRWERRYDVTAIGPNGLNVADGRVYGVTTTFVFALEQRTGRELWRRTLVRHDHEGIDMAPGEHDGVVFVSTVPARPEVQYGPGARPVLWALDGATGRPRWHWAQLPRDLWGAPDVNTGGGMWHPPAFDGRGHLYVSVANPAPFPGTDRQPWGASRPGPNKWTNSILKLDERSGRIVWGRQVLPHDLYDWDLQGPVILTRVRGRDVALVAGKMGYVFEFDAGSG